MPLDEFEVIRRFFAGLTRARADVVLGIGDDAAVLQLPPGQELVATTDTLVCGVHFAQDAAPFDTGFKALAVNLSDIAAMGAEPRWATLALTIPRADAGWLQAFTDGFRELADRHHVCLVGGNLAHGPLNITVQVLGCVPAGAAIRRGTAVPGDDIYVTGELGSAGLAFAASSGTGIDREDLPEACLERLRRPEPRVQAGMALRGLASAAIDISDGLSGDLGHVVSQSKVGAAVRLEDLPVCAALAALPDQDLRWKIALCAGDDYELCFAAPPARRDALMRAMQGIGQRVTRIGEITSDQRIRWLKADGSEYEPAAGSYRHF